MFNKPSLIQALKIIAEYARVLEIRAGKKNFIPDNKTIIYQKKGIYHSTNNSNGWISMKSIRKLSSEVYGTYKYLVVYPNDLFSYEWTEAVVLKEVFK